MVIKVKEKFEKTRRVEKLINLKSIFYEESDMQDFMIEFYLIKRGFLCTPIEFL